MKLGEVADVLRSKNAGIHYFTIDIMFHDEETYEKVRDSDAITAEKLAASYKLSEDDVEYFEYDQGYALKLTIPRPVPAGAPGDYDLFGAQQNAPLNEIEVPIDE